MSETASKRGCARACPRTPRPQPMHLRSLDSLARITRARFALAHGNILRARARARSLVSRCCVVRASARCAGKRAGRALRDFLSRGFFVVLHAFRHAPNLHVTILKIASSFYMYVFLFGEYKFPDSGGKKREKSRPPHVRRPQISRSTRRN